MEQSTDVEADWVPDKFARRAVVTKPKLNEGKFSGMTLTNDFIPAPTPQAIQDAILFGHVTELDMLLAGMAGEDEYGDDLRYGIEALRWFRAYYGPNGELPPRTHLQKQKIAVLEASWGAELLEMLRDAEIKLTRMA